MCHVYLSVCQKSEFIIMVEWIKLVFGIEGTLDLSYIVSEDNLAISDNWVRPVELSPKL